MRIYANARAETPKVVQPKYGDWHAIGTFRAGPPDKPVPAENFKTPFPVETEKFDVNKEYKGKRNMPAKWEKKDAEDGKPCALAEMGANCATYLHREIEMSAAGPVPMSFTCPNPFIIWVNGQVVHTQETAKAEPVAFGVQLPAGKSTLLIKMTNGEVQHSFTFGSGDSSSGPPGPWFEDVSEAWGLGPNGLTSDVKGDSLAVADFSSDSKPDFLYRAARDTCSSTRTGSSSRRPTRASATTGKVGPALGDFDGDGHIDIFIPQADGKCKLFKNDGTGKFTDVTGNTGDIAKGIPGAVSAAWGDFDNDGKPDLVVCCLRGSNRYFKNMGNGSFSDKSAEIGLTQKQFNSQAAAFVDLNGDGQLDLILNNEGQESSVLFGVRTPGGTMTAVTVSLNGTNGLNGGKVVVKDAAGKPVATSAIVGGDGRGGQSGLAPRFVLAPGAYKVELIGADGKAVAKDVTVANTPMNVKVQ
ncbi:MAG: VCBS repeat-containing protein [Gemmataceae bacterium]